MPTDMSAEINLKCEMALGNAIKSHSNAFPDIYLSMMFHDCHVALLLRAIA
jgi:hypothetical protein